MPRLVPTFPADKGMKTAEAADIQLKLEATLLRKKERQAAKARKELSYMDHGFDPASNAAFFKGTQTIRYDYSQT